MIIKIQIVMALVFGMVAWNGVGNLVKEARREAMAEAYMNFSLRQLTEVTIRG